jgi:hypothetical protein
LNDRTAPCYDLLRFRYISFASNFLYGEGRDEFKHALIWWRDISSLLGDDIDIDFWKEKWIGMTPLRHIFPSLFNLSVQQDGFIFDMGTW